MYTVIAFDVVDDKMRAKLAKALEGHGSRVQKSLFEIPELPPAAYLRLRSRLEGLIEPTVDRIRYYRLCSTCVGRIELVGPGPGVLEDVQLTFLRSPPAL